MFTDEEKRLIKMTILEKINIFVQCPNMWQNDQKTYKKILNKLDKTVIDESKLHKWKL